MKNMREKSAADFCPRQPFTLSMKTIVETIENHLERNKINTIFTYLEDGENSARTLALADLQTAARKFAAALAADSRVLILLPQGLEFIKAFFGCLYARAIAVPTPLPTKNRGWERLSAIFDDAKISVIVTDRATFNNLSRWFGADFSGLPVRWLFVEEIERENPVAAARFCLPEAERIAFLQYTSGSTARPKAVMVTHENIVANSKIIRDCFQNSAASASVCWLPSFHDMGLIDGVIQPVFTGFHGTLMSPTHFLQKPARWFKAITRGGATYSGGPNFAFDFCASRISDEELADVDLRGLRCLYNGSEPIRANTIEKFVGRFASVGFTREKIFTCYGLAEATLAVTASAVKNAPPVLKIDKNDFLSKKISRAENEPHVELVGCGRVYGDTMLKIVEPESGRDCGENEIGEIWVAGRSVTAGYWNAAAATDESFIMKGGERFFKTGDLGFLAGGELFVTGRLKDLIIIRGKNHYPQDIEQTVAASHEFLMPNGGAAFAVEIENEEKLVVLQEIKRACLNYADSAVIFSLILAGLSRHHGLIPHEIILLYPANLPKTTSGKIQRGLARKLWLEKKLNALDFWRERDKLENTANENTTGNNFVAARANRRGN
jgi:acyl-CoA synthetase (AMP-forming)/AMP-acid ligase II